jgi:hypothetical protein
VSIQLASNLVPLAELESLPRRYRRILDRGVHGGAVGTGAETIQSIPVQPFTVDPGLFFQLTSKQVNPIPGIAHPGAGQSWARQLPQVGIVSRLRVIFQGTATVVTANAVTGKAWPYGLIKNLKLSANGQNDLVSCDGLDLHVLRSLRYPAFAESVHIPAFPLGAGSTLTVGTTDLYFGWEVPIAMDEVSLIGSLFAQSSSTNLTVQVTVATNSELFTTNPGNVTITGSWTVEETFYEVPFGDKGELIIPDLSRLHGINAFDTPFTATGDVTATLIRSQGQLHRVLVRAEHGSATNRLSAAPWAPNSRRIDALRLEYGGNKRPYVFNPAASLLELNNQHYGDPLPYDYLGLDFARENPIRDTILMQGVTELKTVVTVNNAVTVTNGQLHIVQETLF